MAVLFAPKGVRTPRAGIGSTMNAFFPEKGELTGLDTRDCVTSRQGWR
ncbi:hypothetical protein [Nonomuraea turkmeniaca]|nr:hypothetical protein [Nonomuraea turkmeniaca]